MKRGSRPHESEYASEYSYGLGQDPDKGKINPSHDAKTEADRFAKGKLPKEAWIGQEGGPDDHEDDSKPAHEVEDPHIDPETQILLNDLIDKLGSGKIRPRDIDLEELARETGIDKDILEDLLFPEPEEEIKEEITEAEERPYGYSLEPKKAYRRDTRRPVAAREHGGTSAKVSGMREYRGPKSYMYPTGPAKDLREFLRGEHYRKERVLLNAPRDGVGVIDEWHPSRHGSGHNVLRGKRPPQKPSAKNTNRGVKEKVA